MKRVLIVDPKETNLQDLEALLKGRGYSVETVRDGAEALAKARQSPPDLIIADVPMPGMDGYTVLRHWKTDARLQRIPFIVHAASDAEAEDERQALRLGADAFIRKPAEPEDFLARLQEAQTRAVAVPAAPAGNPGGEEQNRLKVYSETLIHKLEEKTLQLEETNRLLQRDIAERKQAEAALRASEERFRLLSNATNDAIWDYDVVQDRLWWSEGFATLFGYAPGTVTPSYQAWAERVHPEDRERVMAHVDGAVSAGQANFTNEYRFCRADGSYAYVLDRGHVIRDATGKLVRMMGGMTDLTERRQAEEKLREQAALLEKAQDAIIVRDLAHRITFWNPSAERLYGWSAAEVLGRSVHDFMYVDPTPCRVASAVAMEKGEWVGEAEQLTKDGRLLIVECRLTLVRDHAGRPQSLLAINTDVTGRKRIEAQFLRAQRMESIGTLAGGIAHDLNNILTPIMMSVEFLRIKLEDSAARSTLDTLATCAQRGAELVKQVLAFGRGVEGKRLLVNPAHIAREIHKIARDTFPKNIQLRLSLARDLWTVTGDPTQLHQVLLNICVNARDAMATGGELRITMQNVLLDEVFASANPEATVGPHVLMEIADTGPGIPPAIRDRIFEPFFSTKAPGKGTGLGLSTTLAIVKSHGGFIILESAPGKETKFRIYLPANTTATREESEASESTALPRGAGELILVVDDEAGVRNVAQKTLERFGYRVLLACHGAEGVSLYALHRAQIAAILTDMAMPVMDGGNLIVAIKTLNPGAKIVVSSGLTSDADRQKAADAGVKHFIPKPYTAPVLLQTLHELLGDEK